VETGGQSEVAVTAVDADGDSLTYTWAADGGTVSGTGAAVTWTAPAVEGTYTISCRASDGLADSDQKSIEIDAVTPGGGIDPGGVWALEELQFVYLLLPHIYYDVSLTIEGGGATGSVVLVGHYEDEPASRWEGTYRRIGNHLHAIDMGTEGDLMDLRLVFDGESVSGTARHHWMESEDFEVSAEDEVSGTRLSTIWSSVDRTARE
jgi:hypothetical protein